MTHRTDTNRPQSETRDSSSGNGQAPDPELRLEQIMEDLRQADHSVESVRRAIAENPDLASRINEEVALEKLLCKSAPPLAPERIGHYHIRGELGQGGMGKIYKGWDSELYRHVAIKTIRQNTDAVDHQRRFLREQRILARLHETRIIPIFEAGTFEHAGRTELYYVMPLIEGAIALGDVLACAKCVQSDQETPRLSDLVLKAHSRTDGVPTGSAADAAVDDRSSALQAATPSGSGLPPDPRDCLTVPPAPQSAAAGERPARQIDPIRHSTEYLRSVARIMVDVAIAVDFAHSRKIVHRDCKPDNILITPGEEVFLLDFGLACAIDSNGEPIAQQPHDLAENELTYVFTEGIGGTPEYMSPEQFAGKATSQTDVWSVAATLYELLTFEKPFGSDRKRLAEQVRTEPPRKMQTFAANVPKDLEAICLKAMEKEPARRYRSAAEFGHDLHNWLNGFPTIARPARAPRRIALWSRRNPGWAAAIVLAICASVLFTGAQSIERAKAVRRSQESERESQMQRMQRIRLNAHRMGWSRETLQAARNAAAIQRDDRLRDEVVACLTGFDASHLKKWDFGGTAAAFSGDGERLLIGGSRDGAQIWTKNADQFDTPLPAGTGPVAFSANGDGFLWAAQTPWSFALWNVSGRKEAMRVEVPLPAGVKKPTDQRLLDQLRMRVITAMNSDGSFLAASVPTTDVAGKWSDEAAATYVWNAAGQVLWQTEGEGSSLCFSPDGKLLAIGRDSGAIDVLSLADGTITAKLRQGRNRIESLDFAADPLREDEQTHWLLAAGDSGGTVTIWDVTAQMPRSHCRGSHYNVYAVRFSPDRMTLASGGRWAVRLWDYLTGQQLLEIRDTGDNISGLAFSPDGRHLAICGPSQASFVSLEPGRGITMLRGMSSQVVKTCLSADGKVVVALGQNWEIGVFETNPARLRYLLPGPRGFTADNSALALSQNNKFLATSSGNEARIFDLENGTLIKHHALPPGLVDCLAYTPDGRLLSIRVECLDGTTAPMSDAHPEKFPRVMRVRNLSGDDPVKTLHEFTRFNWHVFCGMLHPEGRFFVADGLHQGVEGRSQEIIAIDVTTGKELWRQQRSKFHYGPSVVMEAKGTTVAYTADQGDSADHVDLLSGESRGRTSGIAYAITQRGRRTLTAGDSSTYGDACGFALWDRRVNDPILTLGIDFHGFGISANFSQDGRTLVFGTMEGVVFVCDLKTIDRALVELEFPHRDLE